MKLSMLVSPGTWDLVDRLRPHLDVTIDLFDSGLSPALPERKDSVASRLRKLPLDAGADGDAASSPRHRFLTALRTSNSQLFTAEGLRVALFPLRHDREIVGLLATAAPVGQQVRDEGDESEPDTGAAPPAQRSFSFFPPPLAAEPASTAALAERPVIDPVSRRIERIGWSLRATIEADIDTHERLGDEQQRSRWLATTLRFLEHLHACESDEELAEALVQAAAIWGDVDARLYRRDLSGDFVLHTALPGLAADPGPRALSAAIAEAQPSVTRITSIAEIEQLGWRGGAHTEVMLMPVPGAARAEWLLAAGGSVDARFERVLAAACRTLGTRFEQAQAKRAQALRERLGRRLAEPKQKVATQAVEVLAELAKAVGATAARLLACESADGPARVLAAIGGSAFEGQAPGARREAGSTFAPTRFVIPIDVGLSRPAHVELLTVAARPFELSAAGLAEAGARILGTWLSGVLHGLSAAALGVDSGNGDGGFEARVACEIERARRFGLEAGLIVVDPGSSSRGSHLLALQPLVEAVRVHLRASDQLGRLEDGALAALLVHTSAEGVGVVAARLERALRETAPAPAAESVLGQAAYPSNGESAPALIAAARADRARRAGAR